MLADKLQTATCSRISLLKELQAVTLRTLTATTNTCIVAATEQVGAAVTLFTVFGRSSVRTTVERSYPD
jgi:hypothetical protein